MDDKWIDDGTLEGRLLGRFLWDLREGNCETVQNFLSSLQDENERNSLYALQAKSGSLEFETPEVDIENILKRMFIHFRKKRIEEIDAAIANGKTAAPEARVLLQEKKELLRTVKQLPCLTLKLS
jgi:hypothetical protein